jgi:hypothetical protein
MSIIQITMENTEHHPALRSVAERVFEKRLKAYHEAKVDGKVHELDGKVAWDPIEVIEKAPGYPVPTPEKPIKPIKPVRIGM